MTQVSVHDARNNLSRLIKAAQAGEDVVIASHGKPMVRLVPVAAERSVLGEWLLAHPPAGGRSSEELDRDLQLEQDSWE